MNLIADLQRLFVSEEEFLDAKTLLDVPKITAKEKKLLEEWEEKGYLKIANIGNRQLYGLADGGKRLLQKHNPDKWLEMQREKKRSENDKFRQLLDLVQKKAGKSALSSTEQKQFARHLDQALANLWLEKAEEDKYRLTASGEAKLFSLQPLAELLAGIEAFSKTVEEEINSPTQAYNQFIQSFVHDQPQLQNALDAHMNSLRQHLSASLEQLAAIQRQLEAAQLGQQTREILSEEIRLCKEGFVLQVQQIETHIAQEQTQAKELQKSQIQQAQQQLFAEYQRLWMKLDKFEKLYEQVASFLKS